jgi:hypothetical protein
MFSYITECCTTCGNVLTESERMAYLHSCGECSKKQKESVNNQIKYPPSA